MHALKIFLLVKYINLPRTGVTEIWIQLSPDPAQ